MLDDLCRQGAAALVDPTHLVGVCWQAGLLHNMLIDNPLMQDAQVGDRSVNGIVGSTYPGEGGHSHALDDMCSCFVFTL